MKCPVCDSEGTFKYQEGVSGDGDVRCAVCGQLDLEDVGMCFDDLGDILRAREAWQAKQKKEPHA